MSDEKKLYKYDGKEADVYWYGPLCIHVAECGRAKGDLFEGGRKPWCQPDLVDTDYVIEVVERCPTGALTYDRKDGGPAEVPDGENTVYVTNDGPLYVRGQIESQDFDGAAEGTKYRAALCRCGQSKNKPFCDNSHRDAGFHDAGAVGEKGQGLEIEGGPLTIQPIEDGPVMISGNFSIYSAAGRKAWSGKKAALCRCGHSKNKPFCDGAHVAAGFKSSQ